MKKFKSYFRQDHMTAAQLFLPFKRALWFTGALPSIREEEDLSGPESNLRWLHCRKVLTWHSVAFFCQHMYMAHFAFRCLFNFGQENFWATSVEFLRATASIFNAHICLFNRGTLHKLLRAFDDDHSGSFAPHLQVPDELQEFRQEEDNHHTTTTHHSADEPQLISHRLREIQRNPQENKKIYMFIRTIVVVNCTYLSLRVALDWIKVSTEERLSSFADTYWYRAYVSSTYPPLFSILGGLDATLSRLVLTGCVLFNMSFFVSISHLLGMRYDHMNDQLKSALYHAEPLSSVDLQVLRSRFSRLSEIVLLVDQMYRPMTFIWFGGFISGFCAEIAFFFGEIGTEKVKEQEDLLGEFNFLLDTIYLIIWFSMLYFYPSRLYSFGVASVSSLQHLSCWKSASDLNFALQARLILSQVQNVRPRLTAWNFFTINRSSMINIITALATYLVVVIQLHPEAVKILMQNNSTRAGA